MKQLWCRSGAHDLCADEGNNEHTCGCDCHEPSMSPPVEEVAPEPGSHERVTVPDARPHCEFCNDPVDPRKQGNFRMVQGWAQIRTGGGVHGLTDRRELSRFACATCIKMKRMGVSFNQNEIVFVADRATLRP